MGLLRWKWQVEKRRLSVWGKADGLRLFWQHVDYQTRWTVLAQTHKHLHVHQTFSSPDGKLSNSYTGGCSSHDLGFKNWIRPLIVQCHFAIISQQLSTPNEVSHHVKENGASHHDRFLECLRCVWLSCGWKLQLRPFMCLLGTRWDP